MDELDAILAERCPATLREAPHGRFSRAGRTALFNGSNVPPRLAFSLMRRLGATGEAVEQLGRLSLSGVQEKYSLTQVANQLRLTPRGTSGTHILKPVVPGADVRRPEWMPANEHLTMQLAAQVFDIRTAACGLVFTPDLTPAYLTRRFDRRGDGGKWAVEDFAALAQRTPATHGEDYKYAGTYLDLFAVLEKHAAAYLIEAGKLFELILFNYLVGNGDAHFRNFSLMQTRWGDYVLAPAYDLLCTRLHIEDTPFALAGGLLPAKLRSGPIRAQFEQLAREVRLPPKPVARLLAQLPARAHRAERLIGRSFLPARAQRQYLQRFRERVRKVSRDG